MKKQRNLPSVRAVPAPTLRFSPYAWSKLVYLRDLGESEVGGFGVCHSDDLLRIDDVQLVQQTCTEVSVEFDDASVADYFDRQMDAGRRPEQCLRHWIHTHPGNCARPSMVDEATFVRVFGRSDWATMFILAQQGQTSARLRFNVGPSADCELSVEVEYASPFPASDMAAWEREYLNHVHVAARTWEPQPAQAADEPGEIPQSWYDAWHAYSDDEFREVCANVQ